MSERGLILAADVGGTMLRVAVADSKGRLLDKAVAPTPKEDDATSVPLKLVEMANSLLSRHGGKESLRRVGIAAIGPLDIRKGAIIKPANMPYDEVPLRDVLIRFFDAELVLINDCNAAVLAEKVFGAGKDYEDVVYITISSGIGGGAYVDGRLLIGKDGNAAEVGHTVVDMEGRMVCGCGRPGHWEAYCGGNSMPRYARYLAMEEYSHLNSPLLRVIRDGCKVTSKDIFNYAKAGDGFAVQFIDRVAELNAMGIANVVSFYDPEIITIGGSVILNNLDLTIGKLKGRVERYTINRVPRIIPTPLGHDAPLLGAVVAAIEPPAKSFLKGI